MTDLTWGLSSCVLIGTVIAIRAGFGKRMRPGLRYALWGLVLLRLLYPGTVLSSPVSVQSVAEKTEVVQNFEAVRDFNSIKHMDGGSVEGYLRDAFLTDYPSTVAEQVTPERFTQMETAIRVRDILEPVWHVGIAVTVVAFLVSNLNFHRALCKRRKPLDAECPLRVYSVESLSSSCLFGNAIYVAAETAMDETRLRHVLAHELSHYLNCDHIWALLRCAALALHWYNPLVWWAAALSRQDSELCADAGALKRLGENERENYGATLIELSARRAPKASLFCTATTMTNGKKSLRERVTMIARRPRMTVAVVIAVVVIAAVATGCAFAGAETEQREFPMNGENISNLDTDRILSQISKVEKQEDSSMLCVNADNFEYFTSTFDWAEDGAIRYFYVTNQKTYSAQLRVFIEKSTYFITESQSWTQQGRIYKLKNYLDALKYLPQEEIRQLSPDADKYLVSCTEDGMPDDLDRVITYGSEGVAEQDGWTIHLMVLPMHAEDGAYHGTSDEVIHLFYNEYSAQNAVSPDATKPDSVASQLRAAADAVFGTVDSEGLEPFFLRVTADGRTDDYTVEPEPVHNVEFATGNVLETAFVWSPLSETEIAAAQAEDKVLQIWNAQESFDVYGDYVLHWTERGSGAEHWLRGLSKLDWIGSLYDYFLEQYARQAELDRPLREIAVPGTVTDYEKVARQVAEQFAAIMRQHPKWCDFSPYDAAVTNTSVFDAYYGEDYPNFCFGMGLALKLDESNKLYFEAGSGLDDPIADGPYKGWYYWGGEVVVGLRDGAWRYLDMNSGGSSVWLPYGIGYDYPQEYPLTTAQVLELYELTGGETHDFRLLQMLVYKPVDEMRATMATMSAAQRQELLDNMVRYNEDYGGLGSNGFFTLSEFD